MCKFTQQCTGCGADVDYTEAILNDVLCRGLEDTEDLLGDRNQNMTLEQVLGFVEAKEAGKRSASRLLLPQATDAVAGNLYRKQKKPSIKGPTQEDQDTCTYCGTRGHRRNPPTRVRRTECPAFGTKCNHCNKNHHFERMCRGKQGTRSTKNTEHDDAISDTLCEITSVDSTKSTTLDHHVFDNLTIECSRRQSKPQPYIRLQMGIQQEDYNYFGFTLRIPQKQSPVSAMADTGCQSCLAGLKIVKKLGLSTKDLNLKMHAADNHDIRATILRLSGRNGKGEVKSTRQMVYVTSKTDKLFLSREACTDLRIIPHKFPTMDEAEGTNPDNSIGATAVSPPHQECQCPKRAKPPPTPTSLPYPATEANRERLQQYLLDYYSSSTFNICEHQTLPLMGGPPMRLMINPHATPTAYHTPIPVPLHWQDDVKAGLDRDVRLGVIEPVPIGEPVTWCHRMVICAKKNGTPRRTIDFQPLNTHATRETHHTQVTFPPSEIGPPRKEENRL